LGVPVLRLFFYHIFFDDWRDFVVEDHVLLNSSVIIAAPHFPYQTDEVASRQDIANRSVFSDPLRKIQVYLEFLPLPDAQR
jgi:hypothetical protein